MNNLVKAFREWQLYNPDISCQCATHFKLDGEPLADKVVCDRERAWRNYVRVRDGIQVAKDTVKGVSNEQIL